MKTVELVCVECPVGCALKVRVENGKAVSVEGNSCLRGKLYGETEVVSPMRTVTSTVRANNGKMVSVKTEKPVKKEDVFYVMEKIKKASCVIPCRVGDIVIENIVDGVNLIATTTVEE